MFRKVYNTGTFAFLSLSLSLFIKFILLINKTQYGNVAFCCVKSHLFKRTKGLEEIAKKVYFSGLRRDSGVVGHYRPSYLFEKREGNIFNKSNP